MGIVGDIVNRVFSPERANRWLRAYIHHRNLYNKGQAELGMFRNLVSYQAVLVTYLSADNLLTKLGWNLALWVVFAGLAVAVGFKILLQWSVGWWWDRNQVFQKEADWSNIRNPVQKAMSEHLLDGRGIEE